MQANFDLVRFAAKFLSLAALLSLFPYHALAQIYGLYSTERNILKGLIDYEDQSFFMAQTIWVHMVGTNDLRLSWGNFKATKQRIKFKNCPFRGLPRYSLWESKTLWFSEAFDYFSYNGCSRGQDIESYKEWKGLNLSDTLSMYYLRLNTASFFCNRDSRGSDFIGEGITGLPADSVQLRFEDGTVKTIPCMRPGTIDNGKRYVQRALDNCVYAQFPRPTEGLLKSFRLKDTQDNYLPWFDLDPDDKRLFIELLYLQIDKEKTKKFGYYANKNEHFYCLDGEVAQGLNDSTWLFNGEELRLRPIQQPLESNSLHYRVAFFKKRPNDPAFNFKVLDALPKGCRNERRTYSPHLEAEQPTRICPKAKRRSRRRGLR